MIRLPRSTDELHGLRAARWIRESTSGQYDHNGPDAQRKLQDGSIKRFGLVDTGLVWEPAHSGATVYRSQAMRAMLEAARSGQFDVLLVAYSARWQRNLRQTLNLLDDTLHPAGVAVWFVDEEILSSNERHWDQLVDQAKADESWLRKHRRRVAEGYAAKLARLRDPGGRPPFGFRRNDSKLIEVDPDQTERVRDVFEFSATGLTDHQVADQTGIPLFTVRGMLTSPLYIGRLRDGGSANWPAVIDRPTWERVQARRAHRATNAGRPPDPRRPYALTMLHCMSCGGRITGDSGYYRHRDACAEFTDARPAKRRGTGTGYRQDWYEGLVTQLLDRAHIDDATIAQVVAVVSRPSVDRLALTRIERERDAALTRYRTERDMESLDMTMRRLDEETERAQTPQGPDISADRVVAKLRSLSETWRKSPQTRHLLADQLFSRVEVLAFKRARFYTTSDALALGLAAVLPVSCSLPVYGRGERSWTRTLRCRADLIAPREAVPLHAVRSA